MSLVGHASGASGAAHRPTSGELRTRTRISSCGRGDQRRDVPDGYSITASARTISDGGIVSPSAFAGLLITSSNRVCLSQRQLAPARAGPVAISARGSGSLGELVLDRSLEIQQLLHARSPHHALKMRRAVREARQVELELPRPPLTPEEMRIRGREVIEEFTAGQEVVGDLEQLHQVRGREPLHALPRYLRHHRPAAES